ncbi:E2 protein [Tree shrew papillomavirus 2]|uniref:Regulatory protein E2 n=1 Tax=Tree shrew papillomavirus 2 TaxID=2562516 RepID=A0AAE6D0I5_9PAPI|nr:E2 protein [Tree shrew papillomavirus 2]
MMEQLATRLDAVQEALMDIYESGKDNIDTQVAHWGLQRREQAIMYLARQRGLSKLGFQKLPPLQVTQENARVAIQMHLSAMSLAKSKYAREKWTISDISKERYNCAPQSRFKKNGRTVTVYFDGCKENAMDYVVWGAVYTELEDGVWTRVASSVSSKGIYYEEDGEEVYYVDFTEEAKAYGATGVWEVHDGNTIYTSVVPVTSSTPNAHHRRQAQVPDSGPASLGAQHTRESIIYISCGAGGAASGPALSRGPPPVPGGPPAVCAQPSARGGRGEEEEAQEEEEEERPSAKRRAILVRGAGATPSPQPPNISYHGAECAPDTAAGPPPASPPPATAAPQCLAAAVPAVAVEETRGGHEADQGSPTDRSGHSQREIGPRGPCVVTVKGPANALKCWRYRLHQQHAEHFLSVSTTWQWTQVSGRHRAGRARVLILFTGEGQRDLFLARVRLPRHCALDLSLSPCT